MDMALFLCFAPATGAVLVFLILLAIECRAHRIAKGFLWRIKNAIINNKAMSYIKKGGN